MARILLTGATGTVGSGLLPLLVKEGHEVVSLVRPRGGQNPCNRVKGTVLSGDITQPLCGVDGAEMLSLIGRFDKLVNCAACLKFLDSNTEEAVGVNVHGVRNLLHLAEGLGIKEFHQVSTVCVAGGAEWFSEDMPAKESDGRNVYERTKAAAENAIAKWNSGKSSIYRLGIVIGDSKTGEMPVFNGYYVFTKSLWELKKILSLRRTEDPDGFRALEREGIYFDEDGYLNLPIAINFADSTLNLVPRDWTCETVAKLIGAKAENRRFHLVSPTPEKIRWINDISLRENLGIKGYWYGVSGGQGSETRKLQKLFDRITAQYKPYVTHEPKFGVGNVQKALDGSYVSPPAITRVLIKKLLGYAKSVEFGRAE